MIVYYRCSTPFPCSVVSLSFSMPRASVTGSRRSFLSPAMVRRTIDPCQFTHTVIVTPHSTTARPSVPARAGTEPLLRRCQLESAGERRLSYTLMLPFPQSQFRLLWFLTHYSYTYSFVPLSISGISLARVLSLLARALYLSISRHGTE